MAGTPTPNYQFPTYAETDTPNLAGAYNQAVNAIDAKIKEVADSVSTGGDVPDATSTTKGIAKLYDSTTVGTGDQDDGGITPKAVDDKIGGSLMNYAPKFTAIAPVTYSDNQIGIRYSNPAADGSQNGYGAVQVTGKQQDVASAYSLTTATVPNVKAVKDYVDAHGGTAYTAGQGISISGTTIAAKTATRSQLGIVTVCNEEDPVSVIDAQKYTEGNVYVPTSYVLKSYVESKMAAAGAAYTGTAPVAVDNGSHTISITRNGQIDDAGVDAFLAAPLSERNAKLTPVFTVSSNTAYQKILANNDEEHNWPAGWTAPTCSVVAGAIKNATPDASASVKGLVQLVSSFTPSDTTNAATPNCVNNALATVTANWESLKNAATTPLTTEMLANLYVTPSGMVVYKAPSE